MIFFDLLYFLFLLFTLPIWIIKILPKKEYRHILKQRLAPTIPKENDNPNQKHLWLHAVSVGEVRSLKNLVQYLKPWCAENHLQIILSVTTPSGFRAAKDLFNDITVINAPLDFSFTIKRAIKQINPQLVILNELEIWPNWVSILYKKNIPILLINGRMSQHAYKRYHRFRFFLRPFFRKIHRFLLQSDHYRQRFTQLGIPQDHIRICGNIKADEAFNGKNQLPQINEIIRHLKINPGNKQIVTIASSHAHDEQLIAPIINQLEKDYLFIIVPRHLHRVPQIEKLLRDNHVRHTTWSGMEPNATTPHTLIFDKMGLLFQVLKAGNIVFMGGTLDPKTGGHNLYEPAVLGKMIIGGPHFNNFPDVGRELVEKGVYKIVNDSQQCARLLTQCSGDQMDWETIAGNGQDVVSQQRGSIQCTLDTLKEIHRSIA
ncbi:MAG: hypothetical protein GY940_33125 [bacterium]|nr:hypothetical protein [bacterium]